MRVAFFNWRDIKNPMAGGAEVYVHQILKRFVDRGNETTVFTSSFPNCKREEVIDGVRYMRYGGRFLIYPKSYLCYKKHIEGNYDVIVESINGVPFFTKFFAKEKVVSLIHQLTRENWYSGIFWPIALTGYHIEDRMLSTYKKNLAIVPSESTKSDLENLGFENVSIVYGSTDIKGQLTEADKPTIIYLGRLTKSKRVDHVLRAFKKIKQNVANSCLWIVGDGPERDNLEKIANELGVGNATEFFGKVSENEKIKLFSNASLMLFPAAREGWGLVVLEANSCGTPVIGYNVHGVRDSIKNNVNGYRVENGDIEALADSAIMLFNDGKKLKQISETSMKYSKKFSWSRASLEFEKLIGENK